MTTEVTAHKLANIDRAAADQRLTDFSFRLLWWLTSAANRKTGIVRGRKQSEMASALHVTKRAVQINLGHLYSLGYLEPISQTPGGYVNAYNVLAAEKANLRSPLTVGKANLRSSFEKGEPTFQKGEPPFVHNPLLSHVVPSDHRETEPGAPRLRADALGAPEPAPEASKRLTNGQASEAKPPTPPRRLKALGPLADRETELRDRLAERFRVLCMGEVVEQTADGVIVIEVATPNLGNMIRRDCEADLLAITGARELKFTIRIAAEPPPLRRMP